MLIATKYKHIFQFPLYNPILYFCVFYVILSITLLASRELLKFDIVVVTPAFEEVFRIGYILGVYFYSNNVKKDIIKYSIFISAIEIFLLELYFIEKYGFFKDPYFSLKFFSLKIISHFILCCIMYFIVKKQKILIAFFSTIVLHYFMNYFFPKWFLFLLE